MIDILLATFNSEKYLREQIDSLIAQDYTNWRLLIRDGGSTDSTCAIIGEYIQKYPEQIIFVGQGKATVVENFSSLLALSTSDLIMFSDHDDVWFADKIKKTLALYSELESSYGSQTPLCVFTDSVITDMNLKVICPSNIRNQHLAPRHGLSLPRMLIQNVPSGNTMLFNAALRDSINPLPPQESVVMHDHYVALAAVLLGKIAYLAEPTLFYRQHGGNVLGSKNYSLSQFVYKYIVKGEKLRKKLYAYTQQANALLVQLKDRLSPEQQEVLQAFADIENMSWWKKRKTLLKYRIFKNGFWRNIGVFLFI